MASRDPPVTAVKDWGDLSKLLRTPSKLVVLAFMAPWSEPWKVMEPILDGIASSNHGTVGFGTLNVDKFKDLGRRLGVEALPTFLLVKDYWVVDRVVGVKTKEQLESKITKLTGQATATSSSP